MKKISVLVLLIFFTNHFNLFAQQYYYTFSELKGMEDNSSNTHLFYRLYTYQNGEPILADYSENSIYHLDLNSNQDSLFIFSGGYIGDSYTTIADLDFWNNDPSEYIMLYLHCSLDCDVYIRRFDEKFPSFSEYGFGTSIEISGQNDSLVLATADFNLKSTDGGRNWEVFDSTYRNIISINPYNDDIFLGDNDSLYKSTDGGLNFSVVDTSNYYFSQFFYDKDSIHIYSIVNKHLKVSNNGGNAFSWTERYSSSNPIYVGVDYSQSGSIYLADGKYIYHSIDYGLTFNEYEVLDRRIVGIYKKPNSDELYAATKYDLYETTSDTIITLKHLSPNPDIFNWFPLQVGNKWIYTTRFLSEGKPEEYTSVREVTGTFFYRNRLYFDINNEFGLSYRVDSTSGKIYQAYFDNDTLDYEELYLDLTAEIGDTIYVVQFGGSYPILLANEEDFSEWNISSRKRNYFGQSTPLYDLSLVKNVGLYYHLEWELVGYENELKGVVINGKVYGDTTVVAVNEPDNTIKEFSLSQNYPNPFNPGTKIQFVIPQSSFVNLKVYDILGREVATLVNEEKPPGEYEVEFSAKGGSASGGNSASGIQNLASGIYFYKLSVSAWSTQDGQAGNHSSTKKMIYLK